MADAETFANAVAAAVAKLRGWRRPCALPAPSLHWSLRANIRASSNLSASDCAAMHLARMLRRHALLQLLL
jgi:hypothetical protein